MVDHVGDGDPGEIVDLAAREDRGDNLMLFGSGEHEDHVGWRLFERLEECVEGRLREHVDLVDDEHAVAPFGRRNLHLVDEFADIVDGVVGCGVELKDVERTVLVECAAGVALVAGVALGGRVLAVDRFGENTRAGGLAYTTATAEEVGMGQAVGSDGVAERGREGLLADHAREGGRSVFTRRYDIVFFHSWEGKMIAKFTTFSANVQIAAAEARAHNYDCRSRGRGNQESRGRMRWRAAMKVWHSARVL